MLNCLEWPGAPQAYQLMPYQRRESTNELSLAVPKIAKMSSTLIHRTIKKVSMRMHKFEQVNKSWALNRVSSAILEAAKQNILPDKQSPYIK